jgi:hypothetical protein
MFQEPEPKTKLRKKIDKILTDMEDHATDSEEYGVLLDRLRELEKMQAEYKPYRPNPDTVVLAAANLIGILAIIRHEQFNVVTTKAMSFIRFR